MNRSVLNIMIGGFGGGEGTTAEAGAGGSVRSIGADDVAVQLAYAQHVIVVPGYVQRSPRPSTPSASWPTSSRSAASTSSTRSTPSPAGCRAT